MLYAFENSEPLIVFKWKDSETTAEGWLVINSLRGGAAGGGTIMRKGLKMDEVITMAKSMEFKFSISGPFIGGAKSGINFDPNDNRKKEVLQRWYQVVFPLLKSYYGTGGDLNVNAVDEVIPITEQCGIWHPQEGIFNGYYKPKEADKISRLGQLRKGVLKMIENTEYTPHIDKKYTISDMINGYGVGESVRHYYKIYGGEVQGKKAIIQGFDNVGSAAAFYLTKIGVKIIGIIDREGGIINEEGFSLEEVQALFISRQGNKLVSDNMIPFEQINRKIWSLGAQIFVPCSTAEMTTELQIDDLVVNGLEVITCGNILFNDSDLIFGPTYEKFDNIISIIPDFIANCGMARVYAYFMEKKVQINDESIFNDLSETIKNALEKIYKVNKSKTKICSTAFHIALKQIN